ncbi:MAG: DNA polymerase III subunit gamma/tau, partial [Proteobacteria bacterium]|nr:DNA polymerase III subunit gamma/tau [Pseudomonadota bacterium]
MPNIYETISGGGAWFYRLNQWPCLNVYRRPELTILPFLSWLPMSLARKYRPKKFSELVGQQPVAQALLHSLSRSDMPQAILFSGIRGTGKTTLARLYGAALNCTHPDGFEACGRHNDHCASCQKVALNRHEDIREIDGASHNSVDDIRKLQETLLYHPQVSKQKIYIIDEVHMLSVSAFNSLLKTLEEPPPHVVFLFATTEINKIPATVISRCQTFHLQRIPRHLIASRLEEVLNSEKVSYESAAITMIAEQSEGSLRDGLSLLDQMIALGGGEVTQKTCLMMLSYASISDFFGLWLAIIKGNIPDALSQSHALFARGIDAKTITEKILQIAHQTSVLLSLPSQTDRLSEFGITQENYQSLMSMVPEEQDSSHDAFSAVVRSFITALSLLPPQFTGASLDQYILENLMLEWLSCHSQPTKPKQPSLKKMQKQQQPSAMPRVRSPRLSQPSLPATWPELISAWQSLQPIQARELSYAKLISYSPEEIVLAVDLG